MSDIKKLGSEKDSYYSTENPRLSALSRDDKRLEKVVWRKLDLFILPVVAMFYLLSFLVSGRFLSDYGRFFSNDRYVPIRTAPTLEMQKSQVYKRT